MCLATLIKLAIEATKDENVAWTTQWTVAKLFCNLLRVPDSVGFVLQNRHVHFILDLIVKCLLRTEAEKNKPLDDKGKMRLKEAAASLAYDVSPYLPFFEDVHAVLLKRVMQTIQVAIKSIDIKEKEGKDACFRLCSAIHRLLMCNMEIAKETMKNLDISRLNANLPNTLYAALVAHSNQAHAASTTTEGAPQQQSVSTPLSTYGNNNAPFQ